MSIFAQNQSGKGLNSQPEIENPIIHLNINYQLMKKRTLLQALPLWLLLLLPILPLWAQDSKSLLLDRRTLRPGVGDKANETAKPGPIVGAKPRLHSGVKVRKAPRTRVMPNATNRVRLASADGVEFWGNIIFAKSWETMDDDAAPFYVGQFKGTNPISIQSLFANEALDANGSGVLKDGLFRYVSYFNFMGEVMGQFYEYDMDTWEMIRTEDVSNRPDLYCFDVDTDPITNQVYGIAYNSDYSGYVLNTIDYSALTSKTIGKLDRYFLGFAINSKGSMYGISNSGTLCKISRTTGAVTEVGPTGVYPTYLQSAAFDRNTDKLYWAASFESSPSALYEVDTLTAQLTKVSDFPDGEEIVCLTVAEALTSVDAPAKIENLSATFPKGNLQGTATFVAPTTTFGGGTLTGPLTASVRVGNGEPVTKTCQPGENVTVDITAAKGEAVVYAAVSNDAGRGPLAKTTAWAGPDSPKGVSSLKLKIDPETMKATLTWRAPTQGVHGGYVSGPAVTYNIVRYPGRKTVASGYDKVKFEETLEKDKLTSYFYTVTPVFEGMTGTPTTSNKVLVGDACEVPYEEYFNTEEDFNLFTVIDANKDGRTWEYHSENGVVYCSFSSRQANDDWLITPEIHMVPGRKYNFSFSGRRGMSDYAQQVSASFGEGLDPAAYKEVVPLTDLPSNQWAKLKATVTVNAEGNYHFGLHDQSPMDGYRTYVDSIMVTQGPLLSSPDSVTNVMITPGDYGVGEATITFRAPTKAINGTALSSLSKVEVRRRAETEVLVHTFTNVTPGQQLTFTDSEPLDGFNTYVFTAYSGEEAGEPAEKRVYIGIDTPREPTDVEATAGMDAITLTWKAPSTLGVNGGYVEPDELVYNIYTLDLDALDFVIAKQNVTGLSYEPQVSMRGNQDLNYFGVSAVSDVGESDYAVSNLVISGAPYTLPFTESFHKGNLDNGLWWVDTDNYFWPQGYYSADDVIGSADWTPSEPNQVASFNSGKISLKGATNPILRFWHNGMPGLNYHLRLQVMTPDNQVRELKDIDYSKLTGDRQWVEEVVDLGDYASYDFVVLKFIGECNDKNLQRLSFDAVEVYDVLDHNLRAISVLPTLTGTVGDKMEAGVRVRNIGANTEDSFTINLFFNGRKVASCEGGPLDPFRADTYYMTFTPKIEDVGNKSVYATVEASGEDDDLSDNQTQQVSVTVKSPELPTVEDLKADREGNGVGLTWTKPANTARTVMEDFESYTKWSYGPYFGDWEAVDVDQARTIGVSGVNWPNCGTPMAYIVYDPVELGISSIPRFTPHSGSQYMASWGAYDEENDDVGKSDDWLISPELDGRAQQISFWSKAASLTYAPESFEIRYSTTGKELEDFKLISSHEVDGDEWYNFTANLPEGTKYFAIRCVSEGKMALFIDDVTYHEGQMEIEGYNVYRNGEKIGSAAANATSYADANGKDDDVYTITVVYDEGESPFSNETSLTGIDEVAQGKLTVKSGRGVIVVSNANGRDVTILTTDGRVVAKAENVDKKAFDLQRGTYLVRVGGNVTHVVVK